MEFDSEIDRVEEVKFGKLNSMPVDLPQHMAKRISLPLFEAGKKQLLFSPTSNYENMAGSSHKGRKKKRKKRSRSKTLLMNTSKSSSELSNFSPEPGSNQTGGLDSENSSPEAQFQSPTLL